MRRRPASTLSRLAATAALALLLAALAGCFGGGGLSRAPDADGPQLSQLEDPDGGEGEGGIGGTGVQAPALAPDEDERGIGGTGVVAGSALDDERGIGGTGIVGTITGFGSILVNGLQVELPTGLALTVDGSRAGQDALRVGQVVAIEADGEGDRLTARSLAVRHEVAGPVQAVDPTRRTLTVLGQTVELGDGAVLASDGRPIDGLARLRVGEAVAISGLRRNGAIVASRVDAGAPTTASGLRGTVAAVDAAGFTVDGVRVEPVAPDFLRRLRVGSRVDVRGRVRNGRLEADRLTAEPDTPFAGRVRRLSIEGFVAYARDGTGPRLGRLPIQVGPGARLRGLVAADLVSGRRVVMDGTLDAERRLVAREVRVPLRLTPRPARPSPAAPSRIRGRDGSTYGPTAPRLQRQQQPGTTPTLRDRSGNGAGLNPGVGTAPRRVMPPSRTRSLGAPTRRAPRTPARR